MKKVYSNADFNLSVDKAITPYGDSCTVTLRAQGEDMKEGLRIPYRIVSGPSPYGSDIVLIDFTYNMDDDHYYLNVILSKPLGNNILEVVQIDGPLVTLEKLSDILYKYKNPLDSSEVTRSFRAILKSIPDTNHMISGVRAFDFVYSNEYGYFELDSDLRCVKTFKNKMSHYSDIDRLFNLSLYYMPQYSASTLFSNNYIPPEPYPYVVPPKKPKITIEVLTTSVFEGESAFFKISYENIRNNYKLKYKYIDTGYTSEEEDSIVTDDSGFSIIEIPTSVLKNGATSVRFLQLWIKDYPKIKEMIYINVAPSTEYSERFLPGVYSIPLQPYMKYEITLIGAAGAGGGSVNNRGGNWNVKANGNKGGDTFVTLDNSKCIAKGSDGGSDAHWHNGSAFTTGVPSQGGLNDLSQINDTFYIIKNINGLSGIYSVRGEQVGGDAVTDLGDVGYNGKGTSGGFGVGDETLSPGGSSGSGGLIICTVKNNTSKIKELKLTVGSAGTIFDFVKNGTWGNGGKVGEHGFAIIRSIIN